MIENSPYVFDRKYAVFFKTDRLFNHNFENMVILGIIRNFFIIFPPKKVEIDSGKVDRDRTLIADFDLF